MDRVFHLLQTKEVPIQKALLDTSHVWLDVRSSKEFEDGSIPDALNIPPLSNMDRALIGTIYKNLGREDAITAGYELFESQVDHFLSRFSQFKPGTPITVMCSRGGLRSKTVTALLESKGFDARQLTGGYKAYRNFLLQSFDHLQFKTTPIILHGKTGVGKTEIIQQLPNFLDLEGIAQHRSSLLGAVGKRPLSQKSFEAELYHKLSQLESENPVFIEGESRKIGPVHIPTNLFNIMQGGIKILLEADIATRTKRTIEEYAPYNSGSYEEIKESIKKLERALGKRKTTGLLELMEQENFSAVVQFLFENYYDPRYEHTMKHYSYYCTLSTDNMDFAVEKLKQIQLTLKERKTDSA